MGAIISSNTLRLEPDGLSFQTGKVQLPLAPSNANTMVFYYKAYFENVVINAFGGEFTENGSAYSWNTDTTFGLSFTGTVSSHIGGLLGFANGANPPNIIRVRQPADYVPFGNNSGYSQIVPVGFQNMIEFYYGPEKNNQFTSHHTIGNNNYLAGLLGPSTHIIGLSGAQKYLGMIKVSKNQNNSQNIVMSMGNNWENMPASSFSSALTSLSSNWAFRDVNRPETVNFRPNHANPALSNTINFPRWVVAKWPSAVLGRNFVITDIKVEYYT
jgi:hypothetical protein